MKKLGYKPNLIARSLITNNTQTIALISGSIQNEFFAESIDSIVKKAYEHGYKIIVYFDDQKNLDEILDSVSGFNVDGILMSSITLESEQFNRIKSLNIPYMFFARRSKLESNYVVLNNYLAGKLITKHLIGFGHEQIAFITGDLNRSTFNERKIGFIETMKESHLELSDNYQVQIKDSSKKEVQKAVKKILNLPNQPTAIICVSDAIAISAMDILLSLNFNIPEDISICGFDNIGLSSHKAIQLTSIGYDKGNIGEIAMKNLIELIEQNIDEVESNRQITLPPELFIRNTTKKLK